jgi:hypothetical protein
MSKLRLQSTHQPRPGEIQLKEWIINQSILRGISIGAMWNRYARHRGPVPVRRAGRRTVFIRADYVLPEPCGKQYRPQLAGLLPANNAAYRTAYTRLWRAEHKQISS